MRAQSARARRHNVRRSRLHRNLLLSKPSQTPKPEDAMLSDADGGVRRESARFAALLKSGRFWASATSQRRRSRQASATRSKRSTDIWPSPRIRSTSLFLTSQEPFGPRDTTLRRCTWSVSTSTSAVASSPSSPGFGTRWSSGAPLLGEQGVERRFRKQPNGSRSPTSMRLDITPGIAIAYWQATGYRPPMTEEERAEEASAHEQQRLR